jgi:hypothetical protein
MKEVVRVWWAENHGVWERRHRQVGEGNKDSRLEV